MPKRWRARRTGRSSDQWAEIDEREEEQRVASAAWLLNHQPFISVECYRDDWPGTPDASFVVALHQVAGYQFPDLVVATVALLLARPEVDEVFDEEPDTIQVWAKTLDPALAGELQRWWCRQLRAIAPVPLA